MQKNSLNNLHRTSSQFLNQLQPDAHGAMVRVEPLSQVIVIEAVIVFPLLLWTTVHIWAKSPWIVSQASQLVVVVVDSLPCVLCLGQLHQELLHPTGYQWIITNIEQLSSKSTWARQCPPWTRGSPRWAPRCPAGTRTPPRSCRWSPPKTKE